MEKNSKLIAELMKKPCNSSCADCGSKGTYKKTIDTYGLIKDRWPMFVFSSVTVIQSPFKLFQKYNMHRTTLECSFVQDAQTFIISWGLIFRR